MKNITKKMKINIAPFLKLIQVKHQRNKEDTTELSNGFPRSYWNEVNTYITLMKKEIDEMSEEIKKENMVYLEDELWDIFWDYLNILYILKDEGYIEDYAHIFKESKKKFTQRIHADLEGISWQDVKKKQKKTLLKRHEKKYGKK